MSKYFIAEHMPTLCNLLNKASPDDKEGDSFGAFAVLEQGYEFSRMLHGAPSSSGGAMDAFYRAFVPELGATLHPRQIELVKRCVKSERGEHDRVGATVFPGLVKVTRGALDTRTGKHGEHVQTVVRRAQVICECALSMAAGQQVA